MTFGEATVGRPCPECGWTTITSLGIDTNPDCPVHLRWLAVRPEPPAGTCPARREDAAWFKEHPKAGERVRPLSLDEQVRFFAATGAAVTHVRVVRGQGWTYVGSERRPFEAVVGADYW